MEKPKKPTTRKETEVWLVGQPITELTGGKLPSKKEVLQRLFHLLRLDKATLRGAALHVDEEVTAFWARARIPVVQPQHRVGKIEKLYEKWRQLGKGKSRQSATELKKREDFTVQLSFLFDIAHAEALSLAKNKEDVEFLQRQREAGRPGMMLGIDEKLVKQEERKVMRDKEEAVRRDKERRRKEAGRGATAELSEDDDGAEDQPGPSSAVLEESPAKRGRFSATSPALCAALDRTKTTDRDAVHILAAAASAYDQDPAEMALNRQSIRRARIQARAIAASTSRDSLPEGVVLTVHWDGKMVADGPGQELAERLPILVSGEGVSKLLNAPKLPSSKGAAMADAVFATLQDWGLADRVVGMAFDTTASNTGQLSGACLLLQQKLDKHLLHFACRHHILELVVKKVFGLCTSIVTSGPDIQLFKRFKEKWGAIDTARFQTLLDDPADPPQSFAQVSDFAMQQLSVRHPRHDYRELLELTVIVLGGVPQRGIRFARPGAYHLARWMAKIIYSIKIFLFREQLQIRQQDIQGLRRFVTFCVTLYVPMWFRAPVASTAPALDLQFLQDISAYPDSEVAITATTAFGRHLWYLSEELVGLAFFDDHVDVDTKRKMLAALSKEGSEDPPKHVTMDLSPDTIKQKHLWDFVTSTTRRTVSALGTNDGFLDVDPQTWNGREDFQKAKTTVAAVKVTNDFAERGVALMQDYLPHLTHDEEQRQFLLQSVEAHRQTFPDSKKKTVVGGIPIRTRQQ